MFLGIGFTNWNIIEKYFRMNFLSSLSAKNDLELAFELDLELAF